MHEDKIKVEDVEEGEVLTCDLCPKLSNGKQKFVRHMKAHLDNKQYKCEECSKTFTGGRAFYNHRKVHKVFQCPKCYKNLVIDSKARHLRSCQGIKDKIKRCQLEGCNYKTNKLFNIKQHMVSHRQLYCDVENCGEEFYRKKNLDIHKRKQHRPVFAPQVCTKEGPKKKHKVHRCEWCSYETIYTTHLRSHEQTCKVKNSIEPPIVLVL